MLLTCTVLSQLISRFRADLRAANFSVESLTELWGTEADAALHRGQRVPAVRALAAAERPSALALITLARFFVLGLAVPREALELALPSLGINGVIFLKLGEVGNANEGGNGIRPLLDVRPYSFVDATGIVSWWIASDLGELSIGGILPVDHVLGIGGASSTLSGLMVSHPVDRALDLGTGCGIQAMHASRHATVVVATDISVRALQIAALNAELNDIHNIEFRLGSLFEPVNGERFGHIVSNPPFVITPRVPGVPAYEYRDGGMVGDDLVAAVIAGLADHLEPGGIAQLLGNWEYRRPVARASRDGLDRVGDWIAESGLDGWVIEREVQDAPQYAETWIRDGGLRPGAEFDDLYNFWLDDFEARGVYAVGFGYLTLRAPASGNVSVPLQRSERLAGAIGSGLGTQISASLAAWDWLQQATDDDVSRATLTLASDVTEQRHYWPGESDPTVMTLHQGGGFSRAIGLDTGLAALVGACDGELSIRAIVAAIAELLEVDEIALSGELLPRVRELVFAGLLRL